MAALVWIITWLSVHVLSAMSYLPQPFNLTLDSSHFIHILKWEPGPGTPKEVHYEVCVQKNIEWSCHPVDGCRSVQQPLVCNLTEAYPDPNMVYITKVRAVLDGQTSSPLIYNGFKPNIHTHLDLPSLTVIPCNKSLCVHLKPPMERLWKIYDAMHYTLRITNSGSGAQDFMDTKSLKGETLKDPLPGIQYCVSVCFSNSLPLRQSNYSKPVCAYTASRYNQDAVISTVLCLLVGLVLLTVALLMSAGFICLRRKPLPSVLTTISHLDEFLALPSCRSSMCSQVSIEPILPPSDKKRNSQSSSDSCDEDSVTQRNGWSRGGGREGGREGGGGGGEYQIRKGTNLLSSTSSSSSSLSPLHSKPEPPPSDSSILPSDSSRPPEEAPARRETHSPADPHSPADALSLTIGGVEENEEKVMGDWEQGVNLLTLTFGQKEVEEEGEEEEEEEEELHLQSSLTTEVCGTSPYSASRTVDTTEVAIETVSFSTEDEESGYMGRPRADPYCGRL